MTIQAVSFRELLKHSLTERNRKNPRYSLRRFAQTLEIDPSDLSKLLRGRRPLGGKTIASLGHRLGLSREQITHFVQLERSLKALERLQDDELVEYLVGGLERELQSGNTVRDALFKILPTLNVAPLLE